MNRKTFSVPYGSGEIAFRLDRRQRKWLAISVSPDALVEVIAPLDAPIEKIIEKVRKRGPWIRRQQRYFAQFQPRTPERQYVGGETYLYLGRQYKLKVVEHIQQRVKLFRGQLTVQSSRPRNPEVTKALVDQWYRDQAREKFRERLALCRGRFPTPEEFEPTGLTVMQLRQRWGSMTHSGRLILNLALIRASTDAIDYVITHELCHLRHHNHGSAFFNLLNQVMPDWEKRKLKLERQLA
jgi:predicted metal-dependent hydrolase